MASVNNDIEKYLRGELTPSEMHALEQKALQDPFLAEALEGAEQAGIENFIQDTHLLKKSIHDKAKKRKPLAKTITLNGWGMYAGIAAGLLLLVVSTYIIFISIPARNAAREQAMQDSAPAVVDSASTNQSNNDSLLALSEAPVEEQVESRVEERESKPTTPESSAHVPATAGGISTAPSAVEESEPTVPSPSGSLERADLESKEEQPATSETPRREKAEERLGPIADAITLEDESAKKSSRSAVPQMQSSFQPQIVKGRITDGNEPIPGANVIIKGTSIGTVADVNGEFQIPVNDNQATLLVNFIGYGQQEVPVTGSEKLDIQLTPDAMALSEVVVVGYGETKKDGPVFTIAEPVGGFFEFKKYLNQQLQYPKDALENKIEGRVTVQFFVQPDGSLTDFKVIRGIGYGCDEELIRLIKEGPHWKPSIQDDKRVREKVRIRQKFSLPE